MHRSLFIALTVIFVFLLLYVFFRDASAQTAVPEFQISSVSSLDPNFYHGSGNDRAKLHPNLLKALEEASFDDTLSILISADPENEVSRYLGQALIRPLPDPAGRQLIIGLARVDSLWEIAADPAVYDIRLANNPIAPPEVELMGNDVALSTEAQRERIELMRTLPQNVRSIPPGREDLGRGWWDIGDGHHSAEAWANGYTGDGVKVLANDTGIDFCHPDLIGTWAVISDANSPYNGWPEMFDSYSMQLYAMDSQFNTNYISSGLADYADTSATCSLGSCNYQPIGAGASHVYTLPTTSQSGVYHIGSHPDNSLQNIYSERVAVLVVDELTAGIYDHVYVDLDNDYDFTDETAADKQMPTACLDNWDAAGSAPGTDGYNDMSGGLIYFIADGTNPIPASDWLWGGLTPGNGELVAFTIVDQTQSGGSHGQYVVSNIVAQGVINGNAPVIKPPYAGPGTGMVAGGGLNAKVVANGNFYMSPYLDDAFLFAALGYDGVAGTADDIQIISNSWANSMVHNEGWDSSSRLIEEALRLNPELTAIFSTGNGGSGYGTVVGPVPPSSLSVGSSTQFDTIAVFDSISTTAQLNWGDVIPFSNRGPGAMGTNGVNITANGAVGSGDRPLHNTLNGWTAWVGWIGTSRSVPVAAGNMALVYDAYRQVHGVWPDTKTAQAILMSGADDQHNDPFVQGAGSVNALTATNIAGGLDGFYILPSSWTAGNYRGETYPAFANIVHPGESATGVFSLTNTGPTAISVTLTSDQLVLSETTTFSFTTQPWNTEDTSSPFRPDYVIDISNQIPAGTDLMEVRLVYPFSQFDPEINYGFNQRYRLQALNWTDLNSDGNLWTDDNGNQVVNWGEIDTYEYMRLAYDYNTANTYQLRIRKPLEQMDDGLFLALRHIGRSGTVPVTNMTIELNFYRHTPWSWLSFEENSATIRAGETAVFSATMTIPANAEYGMYNGSIQAVGPNQTTVVPVVATVAANTTSFTIGGVSATEESGDVTPYINDELFGNTNWTYRDESGDWRFFYTDVQLEPNTASSLIIHDQWPGPIPNDIDTLIFRPMVDIYSKNDPDYYGPYTLGAMGGSVKDYINNGRYRFNTVTGTTEEWVAAPLVNGLHMIAQHNVLYAGPDTSMPFTMTMGTLSLTPGPVVILACGTSGTIPLTLTNSIALDSLTGSAYGLSMPEVYEEQQLVQEMELTLSGLPVGPVVADSQSILTLGWNVSVQPGEVWKGTIVIGTTYLPAALVVPVYILPCDPTGLIADAVFSHNGPVILGNTAVFSNSSSGAPPLTYLWDFGDGDWPSSEENPSHVYAAPGMYTVTLTTSNEFSGDTAEQSIYVGLETIAGFVHSGPVGVGETTVFTNTSTGTNPLTYSWDFGDGGGSTAEHPTHIYTNPGSYTVTLTATNPLGSDVFMDVIVAGETAEAGFVHNGPIYVWKTAVFTNTATGSAPLSYSWEFGDGATSTAENPSHYYAAPGVYTVTLTVTNAFGTDAFVKTIEVQAAMAFMPAIHKP